MKMIIFVKNFLPILVTACVANSFIVSQPGLTGGAQIDPMTYALQTGMYPTSAMMQATPSQMQFGQAQQSALQQTGMSPQMSQFGFPQMSMAQQPSALQAASLSSFGMNPLMMNQANQQKLSAASQLSQTQLAQKQAQLAALKYGATPSMIQSASSMYPSQLSAWNQKKATKASKIGKASKIVGASSTIPTSTGASAADNSWMKSFQNVQTDPSLSVAGMTAPLGASPLIGTGYDGVLDASGNILGSSDDTAVVNSLGNPRLQATSLTSGISTPTSINQKLNAQLAQLFQNPLARQRMLAKQAAFLG